MNKVIVKINGMEYTLKGEEQEEYLHKIASYVDKKLKSIMEINPRLDTTSASVLTAVNTIDELMKQKRSFEEMKIERELLANSEVALSEEIKDLKKQLANMELFNEELKENLKTARRDDEIKEKDETITKLKDALQLRLTEVNNLKNTNKELKFQNQSAKYKIIDLQKKLIDSQIDVAKSKKNNFEEARNHASNK